jgi:hypothetical protein
VMLDWCSSRAIGMPITHGTQSKYQSHKCHLLHCLAVGFISWAWNL